MALLSRPSACKSACLARWVIAKVLPLIRDAFYRALFWTVDLGGGTPTARVIKSGRVPKIVAALAVVRRILPHRSGPTDDSARCGDRFTVKNPGKERLSTKGSCLPQGSRSRAPDLAIGASPSCMPAARNYILLIDAPPSTSNDVPVVKLEASDAK